MTRLWVDFETFSAVPIGNGTHAYMEGVEILLTAWAIDDGPVSVVDNANGEQWPCEFTDALADPLVELAAHNSPFDRNVLRYTGTHTDITRWYDTMVKALAHGMPGALGTLCDILAVPTDKAKDKAGKQLIQLFCKPRPKNMKLRRATRDTHPEEWARFVEYAGLDIEAMRIVDAKLPGWNYSGHELALWHLDQTINDRGVQVDVELARAAIRAAERAKVTLAERTQVLTEGEVRAATQRDRLITHILQAYDIEVPDLQTSTIEKILERGADLPLVLVELLNIRLQASKTSTSKYNTLVKGVSRDGRLRGTLQFDGAARTGRWAGRLFQPQNLPRPTLKQRVIDAGIDALKADCEDLLFDNVMELTSSAIRGCIVAPAGRKLVVADLSNIEGRMIAWLAGEEWKLQAFREFDTCRGADGQWYDGVALRDAALAGQAIVLERNAKGDPIRRGPDLYKLAYAKAFAISIEAVEDFQRQIGKVMELMLGYEGGVGAFLTGAATYGIDLDAMAEAALPSIPADVLAEAERYLAAREKRRDGSFGLAPRTFVVCDALKRLWRRAHPAVSAFWPALSTASMMAVIHEGVVQHVRGIRLQRKGAWLRVQLPSGRLLCYPLPEVDTAGKLSYMGVNQYSRKWSRLKTYGGKLSENITQAAARDVLAASMPAVEAAGYQIVLTVHDEILTEAPDRPEFNPGHLAGLMAANPTWADGLPLSAAGFEAHRYKKG
ncbi:DNA polymerase I [Bordetella hinzii]|uniref:DNA polymerase n=1 Tax=Bordetella hinzii TaxID=103855 RepID=UPI0013EFFBFB|nr:DNA polymerase [Bordetella hinzii]QII84232.1 DNA polymerase I [Bordetella hinzii]